MTNEKCVRWVSTPTVSATASTTATVGAAATATAAAVETSTTTEGAATAMITTATGWNLGPALALSW